MLVHLDGHGDDDIGSQPSFSRLIACEELGRRHLEPDGDDLSPVFAGNGDVSSAPAREEIGRVHDRRAPCGHTLGQLFSNVRPHLPVLAKLQGVPRQYLPVGVSAEHVARRHLAGSHERSRQSRLPSRWRPHEKHERAQGEDHDSGSTAPGRTVERVDWRTWCGRRRGTPRAGR